MDLLSLLRLIFRHWRVTLPAALLTLIGFVGSFKVASPTYEATGSMMLLGAPEAPKIDPTTGQTVPPGVGENPFARYGDLSVVADLLARYMDSDSKRADFESQGVTGYDVAANRLQRGPVVEVVGKGSTAEAAIASAEGVLEDADATLTELQEAEQADPDYFITTAPLEPASTATAMFGSTLRTAIAVMALGGLGTLGLAVVAEAITRRRAAPPSAEVNAVAADEAVTADEVDPDTERAAPDGSRGPDWSAISSTLRLAQRQPPQREPTRHEAAHEDDWKREPGWQKTTSEPSPRFSADNGHKQPTTDRSQ